MTVDPRWELGGLPAGARRYLLLAIKPESPVPDTVGLTFRGRVQPRAGQGWYALEATSEVVPGRSFVWHGIARRGLARLELLDRLSQGRAVVTTHRRGPFRDTSETGPDVYHAALGRLAFDSILMPWTLLPSQGAAWARTEEPVAVEVVLDGVPFRLELDVRADGRLAGVRMEHWAPIGEAGWGLTPFGARLGRTETVEGYTIPAQIQAGWFPGTERYAPVYELELVDVRLGWRDQAAEG